MRKYIYSFILILAIAAIAMSFRTNSGKFGPRLTYMLDNTAENNFTVYVFLTDKGPNAQQMLSNPLNLVTQRSIDRRLKVLSQNDVVDLTDVPIYQDYVNGINSLSQKIRHQIKWFNALSVEVNRDQLEAISNKNYVSQIELVEVRKVKKEEITDNNINGENTDINDEPLVDSLNYGTGNAVIQITQINVNLVHNQGIFGQGVMVASFDAGFGNLTHEAFTTLPMNIKHRWDFHLNSQNLASHSHGTATLSLVGGYKPTKLIGPAFKSTFILARTEVDPGEVPLEMDHWVAASQWADSLGADVITSSLGYLDFDPPYPSYTWQDMNGNTTIITKAADYAVYKGIVVSNSAGNNGNNTTHNTLGAPADGDSVMTVGAVTSTGVRASYSSVGPTTDNPPRIKPDVMAMGSGNNVATLTSSSSYSTFGSGTSWACPMAAGVAALVLSSNKSLTPMQVVRIMKKFASNSASPNNLMGWGIVNAQLAVDSARKLDAANPVITHVQPFTNTSTTSAITMKAKITDNGIIRNWTGEAPRLYFRKSTNNGSTWTSYTAVNASTMNLDTFFFSITGSTAGTRVEYYFAAQDIALPTPKMATLPTGGSGVNPPGSTAPPTRFMYNVVTVGITGNNNEIPNEFKLYNNFPNPFNPVTKIKFDLPANVKSEKSNVKLVVYDILGKEVVTLVNKNLNPGRYEINFDASNLSSGIYFYRLETSSFTDVNRMMLIK